MSLALPLLKLGHSLYSDARKGKFLYTLHTRRVRSFVALFIFFGFVFSNCGIK